MTVWVCTVFIISKTYSTSVCQHYFHKTCHDCWGLHCIHLSKTYSTSVCHHHFYKTCHDGWDLHCIHPFKHLFRGRAVTNVGRTCGPTPLHTFTCNVAIKYVYTILLIQHLFGNTFSTRLAMTVRFCTVFTLSKTYSASICHRHFHKTYRDCCGLHYVYPFKQLFNNFLSATFPYDLSWLLGSALYSTFKIIIQHLFIRNISIRLAMTVGVCTVFSLSKTYSKSLCKKHFHKTCHGCWGLHCIHHFKDLFNI